MCMLAHVCVIWWADVCMCGGGRSLSQVCVLVCVCVEGGSRSISIKILRREEGGEERDFV